LPRRSQRRPIESVELKIEFRTDRTTAQKIKEQFPGTVLRGGLVEVVIEGEETDSVAEKVKELLDKVRNLPERDAGSPMAHGSKRL